MIGIETAYELIIEVPNSESNAIVNVWKGRFANPWFPFK